MKVPARAEIKSKSHAVYIYKINNTEKWLSGSVTWGYNNQRCSYATSLVPHKIFVIDVSPNLHDCKLELMFFPFRFCQSESFNRQIRA